MSILMKIIILAFLILGLFLLYKFMNARRLAEENKLLESYMNSLGVFCEKIRHKIEITRRYRHDLAGYIDTLETLLGSDSKNYDALDYIKQQKLKHDSIRSEHICCDDFIDAVLKMKEEECKNKQIPIQIHAEDGEYFRIQDIDKVCLFVNLLDNAIEEIERMTDRKGAYISLELKQDSKGIVIRVENALSDSRDFSFHTKKKDPYYHGLGTKIIQQIIEKYHGETQIMVDEEASVFTIQITLPLKKEVSVCRN